VAFPADEKRVDAAESAIGRRFPPELRDRLLRDNGGEVIVRGAPEEDDVWQLHPVWDDSDRKRAGRTANHVVRETEEARAAGLRGDAVAIASNGTGDLLVLLGEDDDPRWWDHETGDTQRVSVNWS
jgi:hypothetical protein